MNRLSNICCANSCLSYLCCLLLSLLAAGCSTVRDTAGIPAATVQLEVREYIEELSVARWYMDRQAACSITFDDGTLDQYLIGGAELDARGMRGTFFVITSLMGKGRWSDGSHERVLFDWDQARDLNRRGHEIASHSATHVDLLAEPERTREELEGARADLSRELPQVYPFSFGWPYWRSSPQARLTAAEYHQAARAGGIRAESGDPGLGGVNGASPVNFLSIGARGILTSDTEAELKGVLEENYGNRGWLIPNFHGIDDERIDKDALGWEALPISEFRRILDELTVRDLWIAPFGEVARYVWQRDSLKLDFTGTGDRYAEAVYASPLDSGIFNHPLTLVCVVRNGYSLSGVEDMRTGMLMPLEEDQTEVNRYLIELPPGNGRLRLKFVPRASD